MAMGKPNTSSDNLAARDGHRTEGLEAFLVPRYEGKNMPRIKE